MSIDIKRRSASLLEYALVVGGVAVGSLVAVSAFGSEMVDTYGNAAGVLSRSGRRGAAAPGPGLVVTPPVLEPGAVAVQEALFGVDLSELIDDVQHD